MLRKYKHKLKIFKIDETLAFVVCCPTVMTHEPPRRVHQGNHLNIVPSLLPSVKPVPRISAGESRFQGGGVMRVKHLRKILVVLTFVAFLTTNFAGQAVNSAQLHGTITDPSGAAIVGAQIKATQTATGLVRTTVTGSEGSFSLPNLPVGPYKLEIVAQGFQAYIQTGITLQVSQNPKVDVQLQLGTVSVVAEVRGDAVMVNTNETSMSQVIDQQRIVDLPLDGRQATDLILLSGGAV